MRHSNFQHHSFDGVLKRLGINNAWDRQDLTDYVMTFLGGAASGPTDGTVGLRTAIS